MNDEYALLAAIAADPIDRTSRMVYADWLDEHDRPLDGALQRVLAEPERDDHRLAYADVCEREGSTARAEFIRVQIACEWYPARVPAHGPSLDELRAREFELGKWWREYIGPAVAVVPHGALYFDHAPLTRGFVESVTCSAADWIEHGDAVIACQPVARVKLTTWPETYQGQESPRSLPHFKIYEHRILDRTRWFRQLELTREAEKNPHPLFPHSNHIGLFSLTWPDVAFEFPMVDPEAVRSDSLTADHDAFTAFVRQTRREIADAMSLPRHLFGE